MLSSIAVLGRGAARVATQRAPARAASTLSGSSMSGGDSAGFSIQGEGREGRPAYLDVQVCVKIPPPFPPSSATRMLYRVRCVSAAWHCRTKLRR